MMRVIFDHSEPLAEAIRTFWFKPTKPVDYVAGQFIELHLPHSNPDERGQKHWFTLSSSPTEPLISITTRIFDRKSSFKNELMKLKPGDEVIMAEPMGDFVLPIDKTRPLVFVAGGIGITPVRSMIKWLNDIGEQRQIHIIYASKNIHTAVFKELIEDYVTKLDLILDGSLNANKVLDLVGEFKPNHLIYLSGPEPMIESFDKDLKQAGVNPDQILPDFFHGYSQI